MSLAEKRRAGEKERAELRREIEEVVRLLQFCRQRFDLALDDDLLEAAIYEENALLARYRYLLRMAREGAIAQRGTTEEAIAGGTKECLTPSILGDF